MAKDKKEKKPVTFKNLKALLKAVENGSFPKKVNATVELGEVNFLAPTGAKRRDIDSGEADEFYTILTVPVDELIIGLLKHAGAKVKITTI